MNLVVGTPASEQIGSSNFMEDSNQTLSVQKSYSK